MATPARTALLLAILLGAVALLAGFALSLLRKLRRPEGGESVSR